MSDELKRPDAKRRIVTAVRAIAILIAFALVAAIALVPGSPRLLLLGAACCLTVVALVLGWVLR